MWVTAVLILAVTVLAVVEVAEGWVLVCQSRRITAADRTATDAAAAADVCASLLRSAGLIGCTDTTQRRTR